MTSTFAPASSVSPRVGETVPLSFIGHGTDAVLLEASEGPVEYDAPQGVRLILEGPGGEESLLVVGSLLDTGTWMLAATMPSEAVALPDWDVVLDAGTDESPRLVVHAPVGTRVIELW